MLGSRPELLPAKRTNPAKAIKLRFLALATQ
jgi:hypothetical protein